jgi:hypothetical protein
MNIWRVVDSPLGETIHLGNFELIADYFGGLSHSPGGTTQGLFHGLHSRQDTYRTVGHDGGLC